MANGVAHTLKVEVAVFGRDARLLYATPTYLKKKGNAVHAPSIHEVVGCGHVLVNKPGEMPSCIGCRFKDNCPSTIELLCCINVGGDILGVVTLTSFTKEGHTRISSDTQVYLDAATELALLIGRFAHASLQAPSMANPDDYIRDILEISTNAMILTDPNGIILHYNQSAAKLLDYCELSVASLWHIFPEDTVNQILEGIKFHEKEISTKFFQSKLTTKAIQSGKRTAAYAIRLSDETFGSAPDTEFISRIIGSSPELQTVHRLIRKLADSPTPVLINGETGTGKELVARAIHEQSKRRQYPFVAINCSSVPESLFESEMFGYEEGSFTGAKKGGKIGKLEMAQGGTLFLDELGELPLTMQPKLLRVLQEYELERVGSTKKIPLNIRIIAATNKDLSEMLHNGAFRDDLYYRIGVISIDLPPLRRRKSDIMPIAAHYLHALKKKLASPVTGFDGEVEALFLSYHWPGNVRELQNVVEYTANLCETATVSMRDLPPKMLENYNLFKSSHEKNSLQAEEQRRIKALLEQYGYTLEGKTQIAKSLGISLRTLYRRMERFGL